ncbi:hypothetical protein PsYK624_121720 [Phanerochaete sordida]|uniref:Uncharacterized protein n=1 Tax=Phanerochaete sordida TaxID=48140 RepID=A0A9P3LIS5_9APHY|nr:hypothetical protein PsYK624_121720 [Phanerochaete sordida]
MPQTAKGTIHTPSPGHLTATFKVDGALYVFTATYTAEPPLPAFAIPEALLTFDGIAELTNEHDYKGTLSAAAALVLGNGPAIAGPLVPPLDPPVKISGRGVWGMSVEEVRGSVEMCDAAS